MCRKGSISGVTHVHCQRKLGMDGLISVFPYNGGVQSTVKQLKYRFVREIGKSFVAGTLSRVDKNTVDFLKREKFVVVPVPLHVIRERWRGFNQAALLGEHLARGWELEYKKILLRKKNTDALAEIKVRLSGWERKELEDKYRSVTQRRLVGKKLLKKKKEQVRKKQMQGAFEISEKLKVYARRRAGKSRKFLLVDDVWTSGATMLECAKLLKRGGSGEVWGFVFAQSGG